MEKRTRISDVQRGMIGTGAMYKEMVLKAATDIGLTKAQVEASNHFSFLFRIHLGEQTTVAGVSLALLQAAIGGRTGSCDLLSLIISRSLGNTVDGSKGYDKRRIGSRLLLKPLLSCSSFFLYNSPNQVKHTLAIL